MARRSSGPVMTHTKKRHEHHEREVGIAHDKYQVDLRGAAYYVIDVATGAIRGGPWYLREGSTKPREQAQHRADMLNQANWRRR